MTTDAVRGLYIARWGKPSSNARFQVDGFEVEIFKWSADVSREGVNLYVTIGATARPLAGRDPGHRVEFFTGLPVGDIIAPPELVAGVHIDFLQAIPIFESDDL